MKNEADKENEHSLQPEDELSEPSLYQVVLHNDNFTPIEFVIGILEKYFYMGRREAAEKTLEAHAKGRSICGMFSKDFAEAKIAQVMEYAGVHDHPLHCSMEVAS
jgi:ATP-dependent Clp protease adaptor protein ClpS